MKAAQEERNYFLENGITDSQPASLERSDV
jgi:hypothetical protein